MPKVVAMFGLSGVGKGWLARQLCDRRPDVLHLEASALMRRALKVSSETLRRATADTSASNQQRLVDGFLAARSAAPTRPVLFDGHSVIDNDAALIAISVGVIARLNPHHIVFVSEDASIIADRRRTDVRPRPIRGFDELARQQDRARIVARDYASYLGVSFDEIRSDDWEKLESLFA